MPTKARPNTPEEEAEIQHGIDADPDNPEWTEADFAAARPAVEVLALEVHAELTRRRGPGKKPAKVPVTIKLDPEVLADLRASGPGWQARAGVALAKLVGKKTP